MELDSLLAHAAKTGAKATVTLKLEEHGETWALRAEAVVGTSHASASAGRGWIARSTSGQHFYAADNLSSFNHKLISDAFTQLRHHERHEPTTRKAYDDIVARAQSVQRKQQAALDGRLRGMRFNIDIEPFASVEQDEKARTTIAVSPNTTTEKQDIPLDVQQFAQRFQVAPPTADVHVQHVAHSNIHLAPPAKPAMLGTEKLSGYAINIAAMPEHVKGDMATRYTRATNGAWAGSALKALAKLRTAVVVGVNKYRSIDPQREIRAMRSIDAGISKVRYPANSVMAVFGFAWEPHWTEEGRTVSVERVRAAWQALASKAKRDQALNATEAKVTEQKNLPYGIIRNQVIDTHGKDAAQVLAQVAEPVHLLTQDADGGVHALDMGVLAAYDDVLHGVERHPLMVIGGYRFKGFDWGEKAGSRTAQLTELANEIDRAIREAIGQVAPEALYPTEPNLLVKGIDSKHRDGYYDRGIAGGFGAGRAEGRRLRENLLKVDAATSNPHPRPIADAPSASTVTSPVPERPERGLTVYEENVEPARLGELYRRTAQPKDPKRVAANSHAAVALEMQRQSYLNANRLEREVGSGIGLRDPELDQRVYQQVAEAGRTLSDPHVTPENEHERMQRHHQSVDFAVDALSDEKRYRRNEQKRQRLEQTRRIAHTIIRAMNSDQLKATWAELKRIFGELEEVGRQRQS